VFSGNVSAGSFQTGTYYYTPFTGTAGMTLRVYTGNLTAGSAYIGGLPTVRYILGAVLMRGTTVSTTVSKTAVPEGFLGQTTGTIRGYQQAGSVTYDAGTSKYSLSLITD